MGKGSGIETRRIGRSAKIALEGKVVLGAFHGALQSEVSGALDAGVRRIVVDTSRLRLIDAAGLGELLACRAMALRARAAFRVSGATGKVLETLLVTGLDGLLLASDGSKPEVTELPREVA